MAKATTAKAPKKVKKAAKAVKAPKIKKGGAKKAASNAADALWKLVDHPLLAELLAIGAGAAVAALAEDGLSSKNKASSKAVKSAGKAAAAAIGARLITEFTDIKKTSKSSTKAKPAKA
jgi:hypothetical protein